MAASSSSSSMRLRKRPHIPLIFCPDCGWRKVLELTSKTPKNPDKIFFTCPNQKRDNTGCGFYMWEGEYVDYLRDKLGMRVEAMDEVAERREIGLGAVQGQEVAVDGRQDQGNVVVKEIELNTLIPVVKEICALLKAMRAVCVCGVAVLIVILIVVLMK
ncbi:unnamed protein product [Urochloa decumbens]|uniref:GRF-type domain-containing protein n=1 Tax=Urochloa decumbens TaxID=240449 RepID=A0ABC9C842_9POAL